ncbi:MAG: class I SAM-dependent methyltransferase [Blastocatellia bacterium]
MTDKDLIDNLRNGYDRVAEEYAKHFFDELDKKPFDRRVLDDFAKSIRPGGLACDLGCGPGQIARYLHGKGLNVCGVDISKGMVEIASKLNPGIRFQQGDMLALDFADSSLAGIAAFYSIIHIPSSDIVRAFVEFKRVLEPGGRLLLSFHIGDEVVRREELLGEPVSLDFAFLMPVDITRHLVAAGLKIESVEDRDPYPDVEYPSRRAYILSSKPGGIC